MADELVENQEVLDQLVVAPTETPVEKLLDDFKWAMATIGFDMSSGLHYGLLLARLASRGGLSLKAQLKQREVERHLSGKSRDSRVL